MDDIYNNLRQRIQIIISTNQYKHPYLNDLNLHNCHPHIFPYQPLHPFYFDSAKKIKILIVV